MQHEPFSIGAVFEWLSRVATALVAFMFVWLIRLQNAVTSIQSRHEVEDINQSKDQVARDRDRKELREQIKEISDGQKELMVTVAEIRADVRNQSSGRKQHDDTV